MIDCVDQVKSLYGTDNGKIGIYSPFDWKRLEFISKLPFYGEVLDAGCGNGALLHLLSNHKNISSITGIDIQKNSRLIVPENSNYKIEDVRNLNFSDHIYDFVICMEVIEHLEISDVPIALRELRRVSGNVNLYTVPLNESEPVWWHDKPGGHRQSFDNNNIQELFPNSISTLIENYDHSWILICEIKNNPFRGFNIFENDIFRDLIAARTHHK